MLPSWTRTSITHTFISSALKVPLTSTFIDHYQSPLLLIRRKISNLSPNIIFLNDTSRSNGSGQRQQVICDSSFFPSNLIYQLVLLTLASKYSPKHTTYRIMSKLPLLLAYTPAKAASPLSLLLLVPFNNFFSKKQSS